MESKEYFERVNATRSEEMRTQLSSADLIYIDSCSLMDPFMPLLAEHIIPILEEQKKKIIVIENVLSELKRIMRPSYDPKKLSKEISAYVGLYTLGKFMENDNRRGFGILEYQAVPDEVKNGHADAAFEAVLSMRSITNRILIITQDKNLTTALHRLSQSGATSRKKISVYKISHAVDSQGFLVETKARRAGSDDTADQTAQKKTDAALNPANKKRNTPAAKQGEQRRAANPKQQEQKKTQPEQRKKSQPEQQKPTEQPAASQNVVLKPVAAPVADRAGSTAKTPVIPACDQLRSQEAVYYLKDTELHVPPRYTAISRLQLPEITAAYIPDTVTVIMPQAFIDCKSMTRIALPDSLISIEESAFQRCTALHSVTIPHSVRRIDSAAFKDCSSLTSIILGQGLKELGSSVFSNCTALTGITVPSGVDRIETMAFKGCRSLQTIVLNEGLKSIGASAFSGCISLVSVTIPRTVTEIAATAFASCPSLIIYCYRDSYAHKFAVEHDRPYHLIGE